MGAPERLSILDDYYPMALSGFRIAEYNYYLSRLPLSAAYSTSSRYIPSKVEFDSAFPELRERTHHIVDLDRSTELFYTLFIHNAHGFLPLFEQWGVPFAFTLYPGGAFYLDDVESDERLARVGDSELLRAVIVTQLPTMSYIEEKGFFPRDKVYYRYGGILDSGYFRSNRFAKKKYGEDKDTFDICFVAIRYDPRGHAKGYDVFVETATKLLGEHPEARFHIVGESWFDNDEIDLGPLGDSVTCYGIRPTSFFPGFYSGMDMIISPNRPFAHPDHPGAFDGWPTGACAEAGMCGTAVLCTDLLGCNEYFEDGAEIRIIPYDVDGICEIVGEYINDPAGLYAMSERTRDSFLRVLDIDDQMGFRMKAMGIEAGVRGVG